MDDLMASVWLNKRFGLWLSGKVSVWTLREEMCKVRRPNGAQREVDRSQERL
jgi:hypothetical protein